MTAGEEELLVLDRITPNSISPHQKLVLATCAVFLVFAMFAMTTMADSCTLTPNPRLQALRPVEHIFHCLSNVRFFRQAHKRPTNLDDQFLAGFFFHHFERKDV